MRPQQKKFKAHQMLAALKVGDKVVLAAGFKVQGNREMANSFLPWISDRYKNRGRSRTQCDCRKSRLICRQAASRESSDAALCFEFQPKLDHVPMTQGGIFKMPLPVLPGWEAVFASSEIARFDTTERVGFQPLRNNDEPLSLWKYS